MKLSWSLFGLLVAMCVVLTITLTIEESSVGHGVEHPDFPTMQQGGTGLERHSRLLWLGWIFGILEISVFVCCLALGARKRSGIGKLKWPLLIGLVLFGSVYTLMIIAYRGYMSETSPSLVLSFPLPTAVMLFGLWPVPAYFALVYIASFDRWIMTPEDAQKFRALVEARRRREENGQ